MNCKKIYTHDFLFEKCTSTFLNKEFKKHREEVLLNQQKSYLPATQPYVMLEREREKVRLVIIELEKEKQALLAQVHAKNNQINNTMYQMTRMTINGNGEGSSSGDTVERKKFIRKCPMTDCRGFLSQQWKCGTCESKICNKCNEEKLDSDCVEGLHQCKPENVASMELLNKDTKPCPECGTMIFRISGCFAKNTPILLWNGNTILSQNINIGDKLIGDDGTIRNVLDITYGIDTLYKVDQSDGISYTVNSKHTLLLKPISNNSIHTLNNLYIVHWFDHSNFKYCSKKFNFTDNTKNEMYNLALSYSKNLNVPEYLKIKVDDYMKLPDTIKSKLLGYKSDGVHWEYRDVKIDPYLLGLWLGDGNSNGTGFASNDNEIIQYFIDWAEKNNLFIVHQDKYFFKINSYLNTRKPIGYEEICKGCLKKECTLCSIKNENNLIPIQGRPLNIFRKLLSEYGLINNKHIPEDYLMNSRENRLKLLAGIIDTDGCVKNNGKRIVISQVNVNFSEQIIILAKSLGFIVHHRIVEKINIQFPNTDKLTNCKDQYIINISGKYVNEIPTILPRKKCVSSTPNKDYKKTSIKVTEVGLGEYYGFLLDNNHNFVLQDFTTCQNCAQMFCVDCHCAWNWNTGLVEKGIIHNPHYYEFIRRGGNTARNNGDIPCGGIPDIRELRNMINYVTQNRYISSPNAQKLYSIHNVVTHIQNYEIRNVTNFDEQETRDLRINYMMNKVSEEDFKKTLQQIEIQKNKKRDFNNIYQMFVDVSSDIFRQIIVFYDNNKLYSENMKTYLNEQFVIFENLKNYFNENIKKCGKGYKCVYPGISENFGYEYNYERYLEQINRQQERERNK